MRSSFVSLAAGLSLFSQVARAALLWDGRFNDLASAADLEKWSFSNPVGPYQYYIHGPGPATEYVDLAASHKNPADAGSDKGVKISLTSTAFWNGQNMRRTELIPQTTAAINKGKVFYHFSISRSADNAPAETREHQIAFFESHFTELKSGWLSGAPGTSDPSLRWLVDGQTQWSVDWEADVWHNVAYEIDFAAGTVGFWHSTGASPLERVVDPVSASTSSNGADWHLGVLELPRDGYPDADEDFYFSGVYVEDGTITTSVSGPGSANANPNPAPAPVESKTSSSPATTSTRVAVTPSTTSTTPTTTLAPASSSATPPAANPVSPTSVIVSPVESPAETTSVVPPVATPVSPTDEVVVPTTTSDAAPTSVPTNSCRARRRRRQNLKRKARDAQRPARRSTHARR